MLRELLVYAAVIICSSPLQHIVAVVHNAPSPSTLRSKTIGASKSVSTHQNNTALASESSYESVVPPTKYLPTSTPSYEVNSAVVNSISENVASKSVSVQSYGSAKSNQQTDFYSASDSSSPETYNVPLTYTNNAVPITPYYSAPIAAKTVTIESQGVNSPASTNSVQTHGAANAYSPANYVAYSSNIGPAISFTSNAAPARPYYSVPVAAKSVTVESPSHNPAVQLNSRIQSHGQVPAYSSASATYPVHQEQTVENTAVGQYVPIQYVKTVSASSGPVASKTVSITSRPPIAPQYAPGPAFIKYAPATVPIANPIPIPVIYQASTVGIQQRAPQQYDFVQNLAPTAATYAQAPSRVQYNSVPVEYPTGVNGGAVRYNPVPVPVVHAESFVEKVYTPVGPTPVVSANPYYGYARAVAFSPASAVSRVSFNGLGASYVY